MANFGDILSSVTIAAGQSVRRNAGDTAFEAYTPISSLAWGSLTGTLSDQADLQAALNSSNIVAYTYFGGF